MKNLEHVDAKYSEKAGKLESLLIKIQEHTGDDEYIYGVTLPTGRTFTQKLNDFLIDHSPVGVRQKAYFFELLATLLQAGISLNRSLKILTTKVENPRLRRIVATIAYEIEHGRPFSQALDRFANVFTESERGVIRSSEAVGHLTEMLFKVASNLNRQNELTMRMLGALIYPIIVVFALMIGITVMLTVVVPKLENIFTQSNLTLPWPTRVLLGVSGFLSNFWWLLFIFIILGVIIFHVYTNSDNGRFTWDFYKLRIPYIGPLLIKLLVARFVSNLGLLIESGLPINKALEFIAGSMGNEIYRLKVYEALGRVTQGEPLSATLAGAPFLFTPTVSNMIAVGEQSATLGEMSQKMGVHFEHEIDHSLHTLTTVVGPVLILIVALLVVFFALAVLTPLFSFTQSIQ